MGYYGIKPNYERKTIKKYLHNLEFRLGEHYDEIDFTDISHWCSKVYNKAKDLNKQIIVNVDIKFESNGSCESTEIICLVPFYKCEETDKEYNERIAEEEKEYNEYLEAVKNSEYLKDLKEYERIKNKYGL